LTCSQKFKCHEYKVYIYLQIKSIISIAFFSKREKGEKKNGRNFSGWKTKNEDVCVLIFLLGLPFNYGIIHHLLNFSLWWQNAF
jgi:hypothetical protein